MECKSENPDKTGKDSKTTFEMRSFENKNFNQLTELLLIEGWDEEQYPEYVKIPFGQTEDNLLENIYGGFEYRRSYIVQAAFQTGCGLYVKGENCISNMSYMGTEWCFENDNVIVRCPFYKNACEKNDPLLWESQAAFSFCACHRTGRYDYEQSVERILTEKSKEKERLYKETAAKYNGKICRNHMYYRDRTATWEWKYNPMVCAKQCSMQFCKMRGRQLSEKKGNVFYDLKVKTKRKDDTFFSGEPIIALIKGKRLLERQVSMDICEAVAGVAEKQIYEKEWWNGYSMQKLYDPDLEIEILNIRAQRRECRDLLQDLEDIKNGIHIVHESDQKKRLKEEKKKRKSKKCNSLMKKIQGKGYESLNDQEKRFAEKYLKEEDIKRWEKERENWEKSSGEQMKIFDV